MTIGERLEEARKRKGISLREASEATKIRSDFLGNIEQNKFDFDLPDIYKRGFIKNYARYLKIDPEKALTDYNAQMLSSSRLGKKSGSEWFGKMEIKSAAQEQAEALEDIPERPSYGSMSAQSGGEESASTREEPEEETDKIFYMKAGLIFVGVIALVFVLFGLVRAILGSSGDDDAPLRDEPTVAAPIDTPSEPVVETASNVDSAAEDTITLLATGPVYVIVKQVADNTELFKGSLETDQRIPVTRTGPVTVTFTEGNNLIVIESDGGRIQPSRSGAAKFTVQ